MTMTTFDVRTIATLSHQEAMLLQAHELVRTLERRHLPSAQTRYSTAEGQNA